MESDPTPPAQGLSGTLYCHPRKGSSEAETLQVPQLANRLPSPIVGILSEV